MIAAILLTFVLTATIQKKYLTKDLMSRMITEGVKIEVYNDVGRVEDYDRLQDLLRKGCLPEALQFVLLQQSLLLGGIAYRMKESQSVRDVVLKRSAAVTQRAGAVAADRNPTHEVPRCR